MVGEIQRYRPRAHKVSHQFVFRCGRIVEAERLLFRSRDLNDALAFLNDPTVPVARAVDLFRQHVESSDSLMSLSYIAGNLRHQVVESYWGLYGDQAVKDLESGSDRQKASSLQIISGIVEYASAQQRDRIFSALDRVPKFFTTRSFSYDLSFLVFSLRLMIQNLRILELVDKIVALIPGDHLEDPQVIALMRESLEFFPQGPMFTALVDPYTGEESWFDSRTARDYSKKGTAIATMKTLLRSDQITVDQMQRLAGTFYCQARYNQPLHFRQENLPNRCNTRFDEVPAKMEALAKWVNSKRAQKLHPFIRAMIFYMRYDQIHPFEGGTNHASRFFMSKILLQGRAGLSYPPLLQDMELSAPFALKVMAAPVQYVGGVEFRSVLNMIVEGRTEEFVFNLLRNYVSNLKLWYQDSLPEEANQYFDLILAIYSKECDSRSLVFF